LSESVEPRIDVVSPLGTQVSDDGVLPERLGSIDGKVIAELWNWVYDGDRAYPIIRAELQRRYPGIRFVQYEEFGNIFGAAEHEVINRLPELLRERGCDAVVTAIGH
jgi:hypothetical protein